MHTLPANNSYKQPDYLKATVASKQRTPPFHSFFEENQVFIADYLRKVSAWSYFRMDRNSGLGTKVDYNPQIQPH